MSKTITINIDAALKAEFIAAARPYGGQTAVLLNLIRDFLNKEARRQAAQERKNGQHRTKSRTDGTV